MSPVVIAILYAGLLQHPPIRGEEGVEIDEGGDGIRMLSGDVSQSAGNGRKSGMSRFIDI